MKPKRPPPNRPPPVGKPSGPPIPSGKIQQEPTTPIPTKQEAANVQVPNKVDSGTPQTKENASDDNISDNEESKDGNILGDVIKEKEDNDEESEETLPYEPPPELLWDLCEQLQDSFLENLTGERQFIRKTDYILVRKLGTYVPSIELFLPLKKKAKSEILEPNRMISGLEFEHFTIRSAVGKGVITIETPMTTDLNQAQQYIDEALDTIIETGSSRQIRVLSYAAQPFSAFDAQMINPIYHLFSLYNAIGPAWASMAYIARDRITLQVTKDEVLDFMYIGQILEPLFIALFGHSPIVFGKDTYRHCGSQWLLDGMLKSTRALRRFGIEPPRSKLDAGRIAMPEKPVLTWQVLTEKYVKAHKLMHRDAEGWLEMFDGTFLDYLEKDGSNLPKHWKDHIHYSWGPVSINLEQSTITFQSADQQPFDRRGCFSSLVVGILQKRTKILHFIMSNLPEASYRIPFGLRLHEIVQFQNEQIKDPWKPFGDWRIGAIEKGIHSEKIPLTGLLEGIIQEATNGLIERGLGEEKLLAPIWNIFESKTTEELRHIFYHQEKEDFLSHLEIVL